MTRVNVGYVWAQLARALEAAERARSDSSPQAAATAARADRRAGRWRAVLEGLARGTLDVGSRTPTSAPAWATLEVVQGGFATGALAAGGPLLPHERAQAEALGIGSGIDIDNDIDNDTDAVRAALTAHALSDDGRAALRDLLASGRYRIEQPEEGAFLAVVALLDRGLADEAAAVLAELGPYLGALRFWPRPAEAPMAPRETVHLATVGQVRRALSDLEAPRKVTRMRATYATWLPLADRAADLFAETRVGGAPLRAFPDGWAARAQALVSDYDAAVAAHGAPSRTARKGNLAVLVEAARALLARWPPRVAQARPGTQGGGPDGDADDPAGARGLARALGPGAVGGAPARVRVDLVRRAVEGHLRKHGEPGSPRRLALRAEQARVAAAPTRAGVARQVAARLDRFAEDDGLPSIDGLLPEASRDAWPGVERRLLRALDASVEELVARGVLRSGEAIAKVLPQVSAHVRALGFRDPSVAALYAAIDAAFRRRRSLLLLDYASQARLRELPWVAALDALRDDDPGSAAAARRLLARVAELAVTSFPEAIVPNPLLRECRALGERAGLALPLVDELAADIFMGGFTPKFVRAAALAAERLRGTLYATYYALPVDELIAMAARLDDDRDPAARADTADADADARRALGAGGPVPAFGALCARRLPADAAHARGVVRNGMVIEQQQILTTQNLVPLLDVAGLPRDAFPPLARRTFAWMVARVRRRAPRCVDRLRVAKNAAYAWRQMLVYLSSGPRDAVAPLLVELRATTEALPAPWPTRWAELLDDVAEAHAGRTPRAPLLGWTAGAHPLVHADRRDDA